MCLVLDKARCDGAAFLPLLGIEGKHACNGLVKKLTVLFFEGAEERIEAVLLDIVGVLPIDGVAILESAARKDGQANAEDLGQAGLYVRGVRSLLDEIVVDFLRSEVDDHVCVILSLQEDIVVGLLAGERTGTDDLDLPALVDEDVGGMHVPDFPLEVLELLPGPHNIVEQVPHLRL